MTRVHTAEALTGRGTEGAVALAAPAHDKENLCLWMGCVCAFGPAWRSASDNVCASQDGLCEELTEADQM